MKKFLVSFSVMALLLVGISSVFAFDDVDKGDFYYDSVMYLADEGIVTGYEDGTFGYDQTLNRAELLAIVVRAKFKDGGMEEAVDSYANDSCFTDVSAGQWYTKFVCYAKSEGWVAGYPDGSFKPSTKVNFVESLKMVMNAFEFEYVASTSPWYKGMVEVASEKNLIPLTITAFDQKITRAEMCDLIVRALKSIDGTLDDWLGDKKDYEPTFESISAGENKYNAYVGKTDFYCNKESDCPDPIQMSCADHACWTGDPCAQCPDGTYCMMDGATGSIKILCKEEDILTYGPLFVDWGSPVVEVGADKVTYSNEMFSIEFDSAISAGDLENILVDPSIEDYNLDAFSEEESCAVGDSADFNEAAKETKKLRAMKVPVFENITLDDGSKFSWSMAILATRNPISWDMTGAQSYTVCGYADVAPFQVLSNQGAILWIDSCPEKGLTPEQVDYCADMKSGIVEQVNP